MLHIHNDIYRLAHILTHTEPWSNPSSKKKRRHDNQIIKWNVNALRSTNTFILASDENHVFIQLFKLVHAWPSIWPYNFIVQVNDSHKPSFYFLPFHVNTSINVCPSHPSLTSHLWENSLSLDLGRSRNSPSLLTHILPVGLTTNNFQHHTLNF